MAVGTYLVVKQVVGTTTSNLTIDIRPAVGKVGKLIFAYASDETPGGGASTSVSIVLKSTTGSDIIALVATGSAATITWGGLDGDDAKSDKGMVIDRTAYAQLVIVTNTTETITYKYRWSEIG